MIEAVRSKCFNTEGAVESPPVFKKRGNCIGRALFYTHGTSDSIEAVFDDASLEDNIRAATRGHRSYESVSATIGITLAASYGGIPQKPGKYLIHSEPNGRPHCSGLTISDDGETYEFYDAGDKISCTAMQYKEAAHSAIDGILLCHFQINSESDDAAVSRRLLSLLAGASDEDLPDTADSDMDGLRHEDSDDEVIVTVGNVLLERLRLEVVRATRSSLSAADRVLKRCPLCPFRVLSTWVHWHSHLARHSETNQYCCSGTKQLKVAVALCDSDAASARQGDNYLQRSAQLIRSSVVPALDSSRNDIDRFMRLVLTQDGPEFRNLDLVKKDGSLRRVGNQYYTRDFANVLYREMLLHQSKAHE